MAGSIAVNEAFVEEEHDGADAGQQGEGNTPACLGNDHNGLLDITRLRYEGLV